MSEASVADIMARCTDPRACAEELRNAAYQIGGSSDNISVMVIKLAKQVCANVSESECSSGSGY